MGSRLPCRAAQETVRFATSVTGQLYRGTNISQPFECPSLSRLVRQSALAHAGATPKRSFMRSSRRFACAKQSSYFVE